MQESNKNTYLKVLALLMTLLISACSQVGNKSVSIEQTNVLLAKWQGPYGGLPAFDKMQLDDIKPAFEIAMAKNLADINVIANNPAPATFENTIVALEKSGEELSRGFTYYSIWSSNLSSSEFRGISRELTPLFSEMRSKISQNRKLFERVKTVYMVSLKNPLEADQQRVVELTYKGFEMNGADLDKVSKIRYAEINKKLSSLHNKFSNNILLDEESYVVFLGTDQLGGLSESYIKAAAKTATERGKPGMYAVTNTRSSMSPFLKYSNERQLRKQVWSNYYSRGDNGDAHDNNALIAEILKLRHERVQLLGYKNYAEWRLQNRMAKTPETAMALLNAVWPAAIARVVEEVRDMQMIADENGDGITIESWDYRYYAEKVRMKKYALDSMEVKQYLQLDNLTQALFF
ncbi:MAG: M3 family metallopeptidase, partial [Proteobacteria bacterium]|nr:M3 family metallopeptidase [Pseudomonadota bacterium]